MIEKFLSPDGYLLDLIIPTKDEEKYISKSLDMLARQTWVQKGLVRIIIANYNPYDEPDPTEEIVKEYKHVKVVNVHKQGIGYARNVGVRAGDCNFIISFDADSYYDRNDAIERMILPLISDFEKPDKDPNKKRITVCNVKYDGDFKQDKTTSVFMNSLNFITTMVNIYMPFAMGSSMAFTRETFDKIGGFRELTNIVGEDVDFAFRVCMNFSINAKQSVDDVTVISSSRRHSKLIKDPTLFIDYSKSVRE